MKQFSSSPDREVWEEWRELVNMTPAELRSFLETDDGKEAGLSRSEAASQGIKSGQESARWILKMKPKGKSFAQAEREWTPKMWSWARRQNAFIKRMSAMRGPLWDKRGFATRKHTALLVWGHDPLK